MGPKPKKWQVEEVWDLISFETCACSNMMNCSRRPTIIAMLIMFAFWAYNSHLKNRDSHVISQNADHYQRRRCLSNVSEGWKITPSPFLPSFTASVKNDPIAKEEVAINLFSSSGTTWVVRLTGHDKLSHLSNGNKTLTKFHCTDWIWLVHKGPFTSWLIIVPT